MPRVEVELDAEQYRLLQQEAERKGVPLEQACRERLVAGLQCSPYMEALLAELRAADVPPR